MAVRKTLYDYAIEHNFCTFDKIEKAKKYAEETGVGITKALIDSGAISEDNLLELFGKMYNYKVVKHLKHLKIDNNLLERFDFSKLIRLKLLPISFDKTFKVIIVNPTNSLIADDYVHEIFGNVGKIEYILTTESSLNSWFNKHIAVSHTTDYNIDGLEIIEETNSNNAVYNIADDDISGIVSLVNKIFSDSVRAKASDIHIEPQEEALIVRFRIDGILSQRLQTKKSVHQQVINRIKTMGNMDVNNTRITQGGRIQLKLYDKNIDMRVSTLPTVYGEKITIRLLDKNSSKFNISMIGFSQDIESKFKDIIQRPSGIILITGPTGSGKSFSLYAAMDYLNDSSRCIVTLEDPVEYRLPGLIQVQVNSAIGLTFANGFREIMRQDPDIILIGEIRDEETARTAVQASNTGHLVFSTLHTNNAASCVMRLMEMGIEPFLVSSTLNAVVSQRLVRRICNECKKEYILEENSPFRKVLNCGNKEVTLYKGVGCEECGGSGYKGRIAVQEFLVVDADIKEMLNHNTTTRQIEDIAIKNGMRTIMQEGILKALNGDTTLDEIHRVLHFDSLNNL